MFGALFLALRLHFVAALKHVLLQGPACFAAACGLWRRDLLFEKRSFHRHRFHRFVIVYLGIIHQFNLGRRQVEHTAEFWNQHDTE